MNKLSTEYVDLGDICIAYRQHGSGRALLLLHGNSGSKAMFKPYQLEHFPQFHTFALDSRGHGSQPTRKLPSNRSAGMSSGFARRRAFTRRM